MHGCYVNTVRSRGALLLVVIALAQACSQVPRLSLGRDDDDGGSGDDDRDDEGGDANQCLARTNKPFGSAGGVYYGTRDPSHVRLTPAQKRAVVGVGSGQPPGASCSGTLIADDVVLTATHCTEGTRATSFYVTFGVDDEQPELVIAATQKTEHPELDIAMLRLASRPADRIDVVPIAAFAGTLSQADAGELFEQAGFGQTEAGYSNGRFFVAEPFIGFEQGGYLRVNGEGRHGVCFGDSGGPSLRQTPEGDVRVMGALSWGDESCMGVDRYTRTDLVQDWIADFAGPIPTPGQTTPGCGSVTSTGRCSPDGTVAEFCSDGRLVQDACGAAEVCGGTRDGARCIPASDDPCGGVTAFGTCSDNVLTWCDGGTVRTRDCGVCGDDVCGLVDNAVGFACKEDPCAGLDYLGSCDGSVARWCDEGEVKTLDCSQQGDTCGFVNDEIGFYCR